MVTPYLTELKRSPLNKAFCMKCLSVLTAAGFVLFTYSAFADEASLHEVKNKSANKHSDSQKHKMKTEKKRAQQQKRKEQNFDRDLQDNMQ